MSENNIENNSAEDNNIENNDIKNSETENNAEEAKDVDSIAPNQTKIIKKKGDFNILKELWEWFYTIALALIIAFTIKMFIADIVAVDGSSMYPTLVDGDRLFVRKLGYTPKQGDIVILDSNYQRRCDYYRRYEIEHGVKLNNFKKFFMYLSYKEADSRNPVFKRKYFVKRVIGMPGDVVDIKDGKVYVNGKVLDEPYYDGITDKTDSRTQFPFTVSEKCVFVLGDNRAASKDSRTVELGEVPYSAIAGKAVLRIWPLTSIRILK